MSDLFARYADELVDWLALSENTDLLNAFLQGGLDSTGKERLGYSFMWDFDSVLAEADKKLQSEFHNYPSLKKRWNQKINQQEPGHSGASYGMLCRMVQARLECKYTTRRA